MAQIISPEKAASFVKDGCRVMIGGFMNCGTPPKIIDALLASGVKDLTVIANDNSMTGKGISRLVAEKRLKKTISTHLGLNPETGVQMAAGALEVEVMPQGTFAERIRCGGAGLGGVLTPTGVGTVIEEGKDKITINGKTYLLELPLRADVALLKGWRADTHGNIVYRLATRNFQPMMAMAADIVIVEVDEIVDSINPDHIHTPGILVRYLVQG